MFPAEGVLGSSITFDASQLFPGQHIVKYEWDFGDGTTAQGEIVSHSYQGPGRYTITVIGYDSLGNKTSVTKTVEIRPSTPSISNIVAKDADLLIEGTGYPKDLIFLTIHSDPISAQTQVDETGQWVYVLAKASGSLGAGDHTVSAIDSFQLADKTELKGESSKEYDFKVSVDDGKLKVEMERSSRWRAVALALGGIIVLAGVFYILRRRKRRRII